MCGGVGVGKTALLRYLHDNAAGCHVARSAGVESEIELAYSGLHQLCGPLNQVDRLPDPSTARPGSPFRGPRTIEWHLRKVFGKLGVKSRKELADPLGEADATRLGA